MNSHEATHLDLFAGVGGFSLAAAAAGFHTVAVSEIEPAACHILATHYPHVPNLGDIRAADFTTLPRVDLITGGVPCQPASLIGKRMGRADARWLWPDTLRALAVLKPRFAIFENPPALLTLERGEAFRSILHGLAVLGYHAAWGIIPAAAMGAGHLRRRLCLLATHAHSPRLEGHARHEHHGQRWTPPLGSITPPDLRGRVTGPRWWQQDHAGIPVLAHGLPARLVRAAHQCAGNSIVPQVFTPILSALRQQLPIPESPLALL